MTDLPRGMKAGLIGFLFAVVGAAVGFYGFYMDVRWLSIIGFVIVAFGVLAGIVSIFYGWIKHGRVAITGSLQTSKDLSSAIRRKKQ